MRAKNSINRQNIESVLTLSETGGKLTLIELSIAEKMHCFFQTRSADGARHEKLNESEGLGAQFQLGTGTGRAFTIPFQYSLVLSREVSMAAKGIV